MTQWQSGADAMQGEYVEMESIEIEMNDDVQGLDAADTDDTQSPSLLVQGFTMCLQTGVLTLTIALLILSPLDMETRCSSCSTEVWCALPIGFYSAFCMHVVAFMFLRILVRKPVDLVGGELAKARLVFVWMMIWVQVSETGWLGPCAFFALSVIMNNTEISTRQPLAMAMLASALVSAVMQNSALNVSEECADRFVAVVLSLAGCGLIMMVPFYEEGWKGVWTCITEASFVCAVALHCMFLL